MAGSGVWPRAFSIRRPRCSCRRWGTGSGTSTECSSNPSRMGGNTSGPTTGCVAPTRGRPPALIGMPFDRPVVGYGGKTINTLRLWAAAAPDYFDFQAFSHGDFVAALAETLEAEALTRVLYPDDSTIRGQGLRFVQEYFLVACSLADLTRRFRFANADWGALPDKVAIQLNDTHPAL